MAVVMRGSESAFRYFGGVPFLFDQMKAVIVEDGWHDGGLLAVGPVRVLGERAQGEAVEL